MPETMLNGFIRETEGGHESACSGNGIDTQESMSLSFRTYVFSGPVSGLVRKPKGFSDIPDQV